eukprot:RCo044450
MFATDVVPKFVAVTGGVCGSLDKGAIAASIGAVLKAYGYRVTAMKIDPYFNIDKSLISPLQHGEVFVLDDGAEVDLEMGNFERAMDLTLGRNNNLTSGKVWSYVIDKERRGDYLGKTVQMIPHVADEIIRWITETASVPTDGSRLPPHVCVMELHGTVGDIELMLMLEALRMLKFRLGKENLCIVHCTYVPIIQGVQKTKPTQHTVKVLSELGLQPDLVMCRCEEPVVDSTRAKISLQCSVEQSHLFSVHTVPYVKHRLPVNLDAQGLLTVLTAVLRLDRVRKDPIGGRTPRKVFSIADWTSLCERKEGLTEEVHIAVVGSGLARQSLSLTKATFLSVIKALDQASLYVGRQLVINWVDSLALDEEWPDYNAEERSAEWRKLRQASGVLVHATTLGQGFTGLSGSLLALQFARENAKPLLAVGSGLHLAVIEFARGVLQLSAAVSAEMVSAEPADSPESRPFVISKVLSEATGAVLGARTLALAEGSMAHRLYGGLARVQERHRHRFEVSPEFVPRLEKEGLRFVGVEDPGTAVALCELQGHPFFMGTQFFPEFKSRPGTPAPPFLGLLMAATGRNVREERLNDLYAANIVSHYRCSRGAVSPVTSRVVASGCSPPGTPVA